MANPPATPLPAAAPAYASAPARKGWLAAVIAVGVFGAAVAAYVLMTMGAALRPSAPPGPDPRATGPESRAVEAARAAIDKPLVEPVKPVATAEGEPPAVPRESGPAAVAQPSAATDAPAPAAPASGVASSATGQAVQPAAGAAAVPAASTGTGAAAVPSSGPPSGSRGPSTPPPRSEPAKARAESAKSPARAATSAPAAAGSAAAAPESGSAAAAAADRWEELRRELARCTRDSLIPRIACEQRLRARYCDGHWGSVPECPSGRQDHGN